MFFVVVFLALTPILGSVIEEQAVPCSGTEFTCADGGCVSLAQLCDGISHCADGSDEAACEVGTSNFLYDTILNRHKRQSACRKTDWPCKDGTCISFDGKCDGMVDCPDGSDETHALCRKTRCQPNWFRCTYGACADGTAPCNGVQECADNSDELLPRCRNSTDEQRGQFRCQDGSTIPVTSLCDGVPDCPDGSDETVRACAAMTCQSYLFQCAYGACVDQGADCNGKTECADGSDEAEDLCLNRSGTDDSRPVKPISSGRCKLPPYPEKGSYKMVNNPSARPGETYSNLVLTLTCHKDYILNGDNRIHCNDGDWSVSVDKFPKCIRFCTLRDEPSVVYTCLLSGTAQGFRPCQKMEPSGTVVNVECNTPNYYSATSLPQMRCINGNWDKTPVCEPECGRMVPDGEQLVLDGVSAQRGELPWHAGIYSKEFAPYMQICGGSLISTTVVISAAHCFWNEQKKKLPAEQFAVAVGKLYRPWNQPQDLDAQRADVSAIYLPNRFQGVKQNFQADVAIVVASAAFVLQPYVRPVCLDFDETFDEQQLTDDNKGKVAGWGLTEENGKPSTVLKVAELPYIPVDRCNAVATQTFIEYITFDKICAGYLDRRTALCKGDSGGGLAFPATQRGIVRYYLRGIVSTAPRNDNLCKASTFATFTHIQPHEGFIRSYL